MPDPSFPAYPVLALVGFVLVLIPLPWHLQAWNSGTCLYIIWTALACLNFGVNSIIWRDSAIDYAPVWCDISSRIVVASSVAIPAASLCINRRLYTIVTTKVVGISYAEKRKAILIDLAIGLGIPILQIVCQYIVSGHRFDIFEEIGCYPYTYNTIAAYPLSILWPILIGVVSAIYCILTLRAFYRRRAQFAQYLTSSSGLTSSRYFRLMALASVELFCTIPISAYGIYLNVSAAPLYPWINWENVHFDYAQVDQYPALEWRADPTNVIAFGLSTWSVPFCAFVFFAFFGFAEEARKNYLKAWSFITTPFRTCRSMRSRFRFPKDRGTESAVLPVFVLKASQNVSIESHLTSVDEKAYVSLPDTPSSETSKDLEDALPHTLPSHRGAFV